MSANVNIDNLPKQNDVLPQDMPESFTGNVKSVDTHITKRNKLNLVWTVDIVTPKKYQGKLFDVYHAWGERVVAGSGFALAILKMKEAGISNPQDVVGRVAEFRRIPLSEAPNYRVSLDPDFEGEKYPKYYFVGFV